jgi:hypothetical protein
VDQLGLVSASAKQVLADPPGMFSPTVRSERTIAPVIAKKSAALLSSSSTAA